MTRPVVVIRPEPGCSATASSARGIGLQVECYPLFETVAVPWTVPAGSFDGLLVGSANAFYLGGPALDGIMDVPVYAVGEGTAAAAWERGFRTAAIGTGRLQRVLDDLTGQRLRLLRIAGEEHVQVVPPEGVEVVLATAYRVENRPMPGELSELLRSGATVLLHSAAAARHFSAETDRLGLQRDAIALAALALRIAEASGEGWAAVRVAVEPNDPALVALAREMCHEPFEGRGGRQ